MKTERGEQVLMMWNLKTELVSQVEMVKSIFRMERITFARLEIGKRLLCWSMILMERFAQKTEQL